MRTDDELLDEIHTRASQLRTRRRRALAGGGLAAVLLLGGIGVAVAGSGDGDRDRGATVFADDAGSGGGGGTTQPPRTTSAPTAVPDAAEPTTVTSLPLPSIPTPTEPAVPTTAQPPLDIAPPEPDPGVVVPVPTTAPEPPVTVTPLPGVPGPGPIDPSPYPQPATVRLLITRGGAPVVGATISLSRDDRIDAQGVTDAEGRLQLTTVEGPWAVEIDEAGVQGVQCAIGYRIDLEAGLQDRTIDLVC